MVMGSNPIECTCKNMFNIKNLLVYILMFPIFGILLLLFIPSRNQKLLKFIAFNSACLSFITSLLVGFFSKIYRSFSIRHKNFMVT
jgi:hypothetical protein